MAKSKKLRVKKWIATGELSGSNKTQDAIIAECGIRLDDAYSHEILGEVLFQATDGKYYTITVEAVIGEASKSYAKDVIERLKEEEE